MSAASSEPSYGPASYGSAAPLKKVAVHVKAHQHTVRIGGMPHLIKRRSNISGPQDLIKYIAPVAPVYFVETATRSREIACDSADRALWERLLVDFAEARLFDERLRQQL